MTCSCLIYFYMTGLTQCCSSIRASYAEKHRRQERESETKKKKKELFCLQLVTISFPANPRGFFNCLFSLRGRRIFSKQSITNSQIRDIWRCITSLDRQRKKKKKKKSAKKKMACSFAEAELKNNRVR